MAISYTDVDRLIFERWEEVMGLLEAYDETQGRIEEVLKDVGNRLEKWANTMGYSFQSSPREAAYYAWKQAWETRKKNEVVYFEVGQVAPLGYRKINSEHPYLWVITQQLETMKMKEAARVSFARELKQALGERASQWENDETTEADEPLGRHLTNVSERDRIDLIANPNKLFDFVKSGMEELFSLSDAIDQTLAKHRS
jgi:hypothetical protein